MTQWKIGDRAEVIKVDGAMKRGTQVGDTAIVIELDEDGDPVFDIDNITVFGWGNPFRFFHRLSSPTYETIQINGKLYNLVPVEA